MVSHAVWKTWPSGLSNDKNLGLRPRFLSTESLGPCFPHGMGDHDQILQHIPSWRIEVREERRQARKIVWPVNAGRVICRYQNNLCGIINHHKHVRYCFLDVQVAGSSIIAINHIDTDSKTAGDTRCPLWRTRLLDAGSCCFTHPAVKRNHYSFAPKSSQSCYNVD